MDPVNAQTTAIDSLADKIVAGLPTVEVMVGWPASQLNPPSISVWAAGSEEWSEGSPFAAPQSIYQEAGTGPNEIDLYYSMGWKEIPVQIDLWGDNATQIDTYLPTLKATLMANDYYVFFPRLHIDCGNFNAVYTLDDVTTQEPGDDYDLGEHRATIIGILTYPDIFTSTQYEHKQITLDDTIDDIEHQEIIS